jgi:Mn-dependent DtxR family transcriptional regulator
MTAMGELDLAREVRTRGYSTEELVANLRDLEAKGLIRRLPDGRWSLTARGRRMANELIAKGASA